MIVSTRNHNYLKKTALHELRLQENDSFIVNKIFYLVEKVFDGTFSLQSAIKEIDDFYFVYCDFFAALKKFDFDMQQLFYSPEWYAEDDDRDVIFVSNLEGLVSEALVGLNNTNKFLEQLFYYQFVASSLFGGFRDEYIISDMNYDNFLQPYKLLEPKAVAYLLQTEYKGGTIKSVPNNIEPIDVSLYPEYLIMDNPHIFYKNGKAYLKIDIMNAMTAAGGFAQALERQDLEGGVTNAAPKRKEGNKSSSDESDDKDATENTEASK